MSTATFDANPNSENEPWIERPAIEGLRFRIWHLMFFCLCAFGVLMVLICCCIKVRVPRTKQEIEADYKRKKITKKFRKRLKLISNQDMEAINLIKALEIIIETDNKKELAATEQRRLHPPKSNFGKKVANMLRLGKISINPNSSNEGHTVVAT